MAGDSKGIPLCALWLNETRDGKKYYRGKLGDAQVLGWLVEDKTNERQPDLRLVLYPLQPKEGDARRPRSKPAETTTTEPSDDIPY
jgi:hypothetical protein